MKILNIFNKLLLEDVQIDEDYPTSWNIEEFKKLDSFNKRVNYCQTHLQRISSGSSRIVYKIDDIKVLKLAKNKKGLAQNELEASYSNYNDIDDIIAKVFEYNDDNLWIEMELAKPVTKSIFKQVTGFDFEDYSNAIFNHYIDSNQTNNRGKYEINPDIVSQMWEDEFVYSMFSFIGNYEIPVGDLRRLSSYGLVNRNGHNQIVMIDYGINNDTFNSYYK